MFFSFVSTLSLAHSTSTRFQLWNLLVKKKEYKAYERPYKTHLSRYSEAHSSDDKRICLYNFIPRDLMHSTFSRTEKSTELNCSSSMPGNCRTGSRIFRIFWAIQRYTPSDLEKYELKTFYFVCQNYIIITSCWSLFF